MEPVIISMSNFKGGVGKTSLTVNVAASMAHDLGKRVLVIDMDPQCNSSMWMMGTKRFGDFFYPNDIHDAGLNETNYERSSFGLISSDLANPHEAIQREVFLAEEGPIPGLHLVPGVFSLMHLEESGDRYTTVNYYTNLLKNLRAMTSAGEYDFVIFDCPPNFHHLTRSSLLCSHQIFIPCTPDQLSIMGLKLLVRKLHEIISETQTILSSDLRGRMPTIEGLILNRVDRRAQVEHVIGDMEFAIRGMTRWFPEIFPLDLRSNRRAPVLPVRVRQTVFASRLVEQEIAAVQLKGGFHQTPLKRDYIELARYITRLAPNRRK
ncbi:MAG: ParA family protein [Verrucomicrobiota bacterium]